MVAMAADQLSQTSLLLVLADNCGHESDHTDKINRSIFQATAV